MPKRRTVLAAVRRLIEVEAAQAARFIEELDAAEAADILVQLPPASVAAVTPHLHPSLIAGMLEKLPPESARELLQKAEPAAAADAFRALPETSRLAVMADLPADRKRELQELLSYPDGSVGRLMTAGFVAFPKDTTVREAVQRLRGKSPSVASYAYVVGPENRLIGVLNMRDLLLADAGTPIESVMRKGVLAVSPFMDREELIRLATEKHYLAFPVVDAAGRLLGTVRTHHLLDSTQLEASEDLQILFGGSADERALSPVLFKVSRRLPWLLVNLVTAFLAAGVVALFEGLITRFAILAVFLPIVAGQGGNAGTQSLSIILRGMIMREIRPSDFARVIWKESAAGVVNGTVIGLVTAAATWLWKGNPALGLVIGLAMIVNLLAAGAAGAIIPLAMKRLGFDPAQSSGIFLTTVTDVVGFFAFLGFATLFASWLA